MSGESINLELLLKLRLVVARFGEMDVARWWNTRGQLGRLGTAALRRGFPRTHHFAQARSVFAVAAHRCSEVFDPPHSVTLWRLSESIEEDFDAHWEQWLDHAADCRALSGRFIIHARQGGSHRRNVRRVECLGLQRPEKGESRSPSRDELHRGQEPDMASRRRQGAESALRC